MYVDDVLEREEREKEVEIIFEKLIRDFLKLMKEIYLRIGRINIKNIIFIIVNYWNIKIKKEKVKENGEIIR